MKLTPSHAKLISSARRFQKTQRIVAWVLLLFWPASTYLAAEGAVPRLELGQLSSADEMQDPLPTPFEEYANRPTANLVFSRETSHLSGGQTQITITAIVIEDGEQHPKRMQGIQVDLIGEDGTDRVYLDTDGISTVLRGIRQLQQWNAMFPMKKELGHEFGIRGTTKCAPSSVTVVHTLCPEYFSFRESSGIALRASGKGQWFPLPGLDLQELADAIGSAIPVLESADPS